MANLPVSPLPAQAPEAIPAGYGDGHGSRYSSLHHTDADTPDKLERATVQRCVAVMAHSAAGIIKSLAR